MITHNFNPVFIDFGIIQISWYSIAYVLGIILGWVYIKKILISTTKKSSSHSVSVEIFDDIIVYMVLGILIGGRLGYAIIYNFEYFLKNFIEIFMIWRGGMSFHGGLVGVIVAIFIFSKKNKINFFEIGDLVSCAAPIGIFFGRIANFINGELYGKVSELPWSFIFPNGGDASRHPSQLYEAILEGIILFLIINFFAIKRKAIFNKGFISSLFLIYYSILRIIGEIFREPDQHLGYIFNFVSMGTLLSIIMLVMGLLIYLFIKNNEKIN